MLKFWIKVVPLMMAATMVFTLPGITALAEEPESTVISQDLDTSEAGQADDVQTDDGQVDDGQADDVQTNDGQMDDGQADDEAQDDVVLSEEDSENTEDETGINNEDAMNNDESDPDDDSEDGEEEKPEIDLEATEEYLVEGSVFDDVAASSWYCKYVSFVMNKGIMFGSGNNMFSPDRELSRAEFATVLYRIAGSPQVKYDGKFSDVANGTYYTNAVAWASQESVGVIFGNGKGKFLPDSKITRQDMMSMVYRYAEYCGYDVSDSRELDDFTDSSKISEYAVGSMQWAVGSKLIVGTSENSLSPLGKTSRAECAAILMRFYNKYMSGQFANLDFTASCGSVTAKITDSKKGKFNITVKNPQANTTIQQVQAVVYSKSNKSDKVVYNLTLQKDGTYQTTVSVENHNFNLGTYTIEAGLLIHNGVRITVGTTTVAVSQNPDLQIYQYVCNVYKQAGRDLKACYNWVTNYMSYQTLPIPMEPPTGYTRCQNYALYAFKNKKGNCYCYAAMFYYLAEGLGYNAEYIEGQVRLAVGGYGPHGWVAIYKDGTTYICDPEAQDEPRLKNLPLYMQSKNNPVLKYVWP